MEANLKAMRRYAESLQTGDCLRGEILRYLGAEKPPTRAEECCSLCDVNLDHLGLVTALEQYVQEFRRQYNIDVEFEAVGM